MEKFIKFIKGDTMEQETDKKLTWFKWTVEDTKIYKEYFTNEQMGKLYFAAMQTVETGEKVEVSKDLGFAYAKLYNEIEASRTAYRKKCETNAKNGAKGGKAKAENAKNNQTKNSYVPPMSKNSFKSLCRTVKKEIYEEYATEIQLGDYQMEEFFNQLKNNNWYSNGNKIQTEYHLKAVIFTKFINELKFRQIVKILDEKKASYDIDMLVYIFNQLSTNNIGDTKIKEAVDQYLSEYSEGAY